MRMGNSFRVGDHRCGFMLNEQEDCCNKPGVTHFQFAEPVNETGVACEEHCAFARPSSVDEHPVGPDCSMPGALWQVYNHILDDGTIDHTWSTCIFPLESGLTAAIDVSLPEPAMAGT